MSDTMHPKDTPVPDGSYRINLQAWTETDGHSLKVMTSIEHRAAQDNLERVVMEKLIDLEDVAIREGLQALGWVAPHPAVEALAKVVNAPTAKLEPSPTMRDALIAQGWVPPGTTENPFTADLVEVLRRVREALHLANDAFCGPICDTIWMNDGTTLFDYIDSTLESFGVKFPAPANDAQQALPLANTTPDLDPKV